MEILIYLTYLNHLKCNVTRLKYFLSLLDIKQYNTNKNTQDRSMDLILYNLDLDNNVAYCDTPLIREDLHIILWMSDEIFCICGQFSVWFFFPLSLWLVLRWGAIDAFYNSIYSILNLYLLYIIHLGSRRKSNGT